MRRRSLRTIALSPGAGGDIASAYRLAGGHAYPIKLKARLRFDAAHACSCAACSHCFELSIIIFCGVATIAVFALVRNSKEMKKEREQAGTGTVIFMSSLCALTAVMLVATVIKLLQRWRRASTDILASEV